MFTFIDYTRDDKQFWTERQWDKPNVIKMLSNNCDYMIYEKLAEIPGVARADHRTKGVSLVAISLSQNF
jgi:hypothetical protein